MLVQFAVRFAELLGVGFIFYLLSRTRTFRVSLVTTMPVAEPSQTAALVGPSVVRADVTARRTGSVGVAAVPDRLSMVASGVQIRVTNMLSAPTLRCTVLWSYFDSPSAKFQ